jgi:hypothetical protein
MRFLPGALRVEGNGSICLDPGPWQQEPTRGLGGIDSHVHGGVAVGGLRSGGAVIGRRVVRTLEVTSSA